MAEDSLFRKTIEKKGIYPKGSFLWLKAGRSLKRSYWPPKTVYTHQGPLQGSGKKTHVPFIRRYRDGYETVEHILTLCKTNSWTGYNTTVCKPEWCNANRNKVYPHIVSHRKEITYCPERKMEACCPDCVMTARHSYGSSLDRLCEKS